MMGRKSEGGTSDGEAPIGEGPGSDRRRSPRYPSIWCRAWLGWSDAHGFHRIPCWLRDIGAGGCLIGVHGTSVPANAQLHLDGELLAGWYPVRILDERPGEDPGFLSVRAAFPRGCPYELFMAVAFGRSAVVAAGAPARLEAPPTDRDEARTTPEAPVESPRPSWKGFAYGNRIARP